MTQTSMQEPLKYRKKPVVISAMQYDGTNLDAIKRWAGPVVHSPHQNGGITEPFISTLEGNMSIAQGDFIIQGVQGEIYPCKPSIFEETYEAAE